MELILTDLREESEEVVEVEDHQRGSEELTYTRPPLTLCQFWAGTTYRPTEKWFAFPRRTTVEAACISKRLYVLGCLHETPNRFHVNPARHSRRPQHLISCFVFFPPAMPTTTDEPRLQMSSFCQTTRPPVPEQHLAPRSACTTPTWTCSR